MLAFFVVLNRPFPQRFLKLNLDFIKFKLDLYKFKFNFIKFKLNFIKSKFSFKNVCRNRPLKGAFNKSFSI